MNSQAVWEFILNINYRSVDQHSRFLNNIQGTYCLTQDVAGTVAAITASLMFGKSATLEVTSGYTMLSAGMCELFYTFMLPCFAQGDF